MALPVNRGGAKCKWIFTFLFLVFMCNFSQAAVAGFPYVTFDVTTGTLTLAFGDVPANGKDVSAQFKNDATVGKYVGYPLITDATQIKHVVIESSFASCEPDALQRMFEGCTNLETIEGLEYINTVKVKDMSNMFRSCKKLTGLTFPSSFTTSNVTGMAYMFYECETLTELDLSSFSSEKLEYMNEMFNGCTNLTTITFGNNFTITKVKSLNKVFSGCNNLSTLDLSHFAPSTTLTNMEATFDGCNALTTLNLSGFNTSAVTSMKSLFFGCNSLSTLTWSSNFTTDYVLDMTAMFSGCKELTSLDLSNFNTVNVTDMSGFFNNCSKLKTIKFGDNFSTASVTNMSYMFASCSALESLDLSKFDTQNVTKMNMMFQDCSSLVYLDLSSFNTAKVTSMQSMFSMKPYLQNELVVLDLSNFNTANVTDMRSMFSDCRNLTTIISNNDWNTNKVSGNLYKTNVFGFRTNAMFNPPEIIGNEGTTYDDNQKGYTTYARIDKKTSSSTSGYFTKGNFKIFYELDGGEITSGSNPTEFNKTTSIITLKNPVRDGYVFTGWSGTKITGLTGEDNMTVTIPQGSIGNRIYTAHWAKTSTLTFDTKGGSAVHVPIQELPGTDISAEVNPIINGTNTTTKLGYDFDRWDNTIPTTMPDNDLTISALWKLHPYTITYNLEGGEIPFGSYNYETYNIETPDFDLHNPVKTGYEFVGWDNGKAIEPSVTIQQGSYGDWEFTAVWKPAKFTIKFDTDGGTPVADITQDYNSDITAPTDPTKEHYVFKGWSPALPAKMPAQNLNLKAQWQGNPHTITFDTDGGSAIDPIETYYGATITKPADPVKTGHTFLGWDKEIPETMPDEDLTFKAEWKINQYTITFDTDGGSEISAIKQDFNTAINKPADPVKTGYTFLDWDKDIPNTMPAEDVTLTAKWQINTHSITFDTDGGTPIDKMTVKYGENISKPVDPVKTGYTFLGWDKQIPETMPDEDLTFKAQWQINQYTITFDTDGADPIEAITQYYNTAITAPANPAKKGFTFLGWQPALPATMPAHDLTVKAQWRDDRETIAVDFNGTTSFPTDADKFCNGNETSISLPFTITKGQPSEYIVTFENGTVVNGKVDANNNVLIEIPNDLESGVYKGSVVFNGDPELYKESEAYPVAITANIPKNAALQIYSDVLLVDNHDNNYSAYQWYKDGNAISGATLQFYSEPSFSGRYTVKITDKDGKKFMSCPIKTGVSVKNTKSSVKVYPNPATSGEQFTLEIEEYDPAKDYTIMIFTANGTLVKKLTGLEKINTTTLPMGIYSGSLISNGEKSGFKVIVK